jgi:hypothetical protein
MDNINDKSRAIHFLSYEGKCFKREEYHVKEVNYIEVGECIQVKLVIKSVEWDFR